MNKYIIIVFIFLSSCAAVYNNSSFNLMEGYIFGFKDEVTKNFFEESQYSFARLRFGRGPASILILSSVDQSNFEWISSDGIKIYTNNGLIYKTIGLPSDVIYQKIITDNSKSVTSEILSESYTSFIEADLHMAVTKKKIYIDTNQCDYKRFHLKVKCKIIFHDILIPEINFKALNRYYMNDEWNVMASYQKIHPHIPEIYIEYFYK